MTKNADMPNLSSTNNLKNNSPSISTNTQSNHTVFRSAYSPKSRSQIYFAPQGRTKQSFKDECDINRIMARFAKTGLIEHLSQRAPTFGDIQDIDFQGCMDIVAFAREQFAALPSELRDRFANDPGRLLDFLQNPENKAEAEKLGLLKASVPSPQAPGSTIAPPPGTGVAASAPVAAAGSTNAGTA